MTYVISDLHGEYDLFIKMLEKINFSPEDILYILGDVVDRGKEPIKLLQYIMTQSNMIMLLGNHEEFMLNYFENEYTDYGDWFKNGGALTYRQILAVSQNEQERILSYIKRCKLTYRLKINGKSFILCHAGLEHSEEGVLLSTQYRDYILWARDEFIHNTKIADEESTVIFGHTPTITIKVYKRDKTGIWFGDNRIGIDCGAVFGYKLGCLRLNDMKEFYVVKGEDVE